MPNDEETKEYLYTKTADIKLVSDYTGLNFNEAIEIDCYTFKTLLVDAFTNELSKTEEGRDYLEQCWALTQTAPDRNKLRQKFKER